MPINRPISTLKPVSSLRTTDLLEVVRLTENIIADQNQQVTVANLLAVSYTIAQAQQAASNSSFITGQTVVITGRGAGLGVVVGKAISTSKLNPKAALLPTDGSAAQAVFFNLTTNTTTPEGSGGGNAVVANVTETQYGIPAGYWEGSFNDFANLVLSRYQYPNFSFFLLGGGGTRTVEVGTGFTAGARPATWATTNNDNIVANSIRVEDVTAGTTLASGEANDGLVNVTTVAFSATNTGEVRRYRISADNTNGNGFSADLVIYAAYQLFYGPTPTASADSTAARALTGKQLTVAGNQFTLNSGTNERVFDVVLPPGYSVQSVVDLDNLNQVITGDYVATPLTVVDAGGTPRAYTRYTKTQAVAYASTHRHLITIAS